MGYEHTVRFIETGFDALQVEITTQVVTDGRACLAELGHAAGFGSLPDLVLLDLDLPEMNGLEALERRAADPPLRRVPVIVLSGTDDQRTVDRCYANGASAFISKPMDLDGFFAVAEFVAECLRSPADWSESEGRTDPLERVTLSPPSGAETPTWLGSSLGLLDRSEGRLCTPTLNFLRFGVTVPAGAR